MYASVYGVGPSSRSQEKGKIPGSIFYSVSAYSVMLNTFKPVLVILIEFQVRNGVRQVKLKIIILEKF